MTVRAAFIPILLHSAYIDRHHGSHRPHHIIRTVLRTLLDLDDCISRSSVSPAVTAGNGSWKRSVKKPSFDFVCAMMMLFTRRGGGGGGLSEADLEIGIDAAAAAAAAAVVDVNN